MTYQTALAALADPTRRKVFELVRGPGKSVAQIAERLPVSRPAVSQHLKVLLDASLVAVEVQGTRRIYTIKPEGLAQLRRYFDGFWNDVLDIYGTKAEEIARAKGDRSAKRG